MDKIKTRTELRTPQGQIIAPETLFTPLNSNEAGVLVDHKGEMFIIEPKDYAEVHVARTDSLTVTATADQLSGRENP